MANILSRLFKRGDAGSEAPVRSVTQAQNIDQIAEALADREAEIVAEQTRATTRSTEPPLSPDEATALSARVSPDAFALIVRHETGGRNYYEKVYKSRPVWPRASSGITIGFGYDLGWQESGETFSADWSPVLAAQHVERLAAAIGLRSTEPDRDEKIERIEDLLDELIAAGVRIPWDESEAVFKAVTVPRFAALTANALPGHEILSPDCFGALVSLTFNRGASYDRGHDPEHDRLDRFREMRGIKAALAEGRIERIPALIRSMKRLWKGTSVAGELSRRRENEARLFEDGMTSVLVAMHDEQRQRATRDRRARVRSRGHQIAGVVVHDVSDEAAEEEEIEELRRGTDFATEATRAAAQVVWSPDDETPDYAHLNSKLGEGIRFELTAADLEFLAELNAFPVDDAGDKPVLFGLRGCAIIDASEDDFDQRVKLRDQRPNHQSARCVIGVWDRKAGQIAVFAGSTVPNKTYVTKWYNNQSAGNLLPTGLYGYIVGPHNGRPGCFLLRESINNVRQVIVRRSTDDLTYDRWDDVSKSRPGDNLHPTFSSGPGSFSSAGCQTVVGQATAHSGNHRGPWAQFRRLAGLTTTSGKVGEPYIYMLLTGQEALLAARAREEGATAIPEVRQSLMRLRFGSRGEKVKRLQSAIGVEPTGDFDVATVEKLHELQQSKLEEASDGIYCPAFDAQLNAAVFIDLPPDTVPPVVIGQTAPAEQPAPAQQPSPIEQPPPAVQPAAVAQPAPQPTTPSVPVVAADPPAGSGPSQPGQQNT